MHYNEVIYEEYKLLSLLAEDSEYAFQLIYDRYRNRIYQTAVRYLKSPHSGQEVVQDVFLKLWFERKNLNPDRPIEAWLYTVARNNILNRLKKIANEWKALDQIGHLSATSICPASDKAETSEYNILLHKAIASLPEQQQKVFNLARNEKRTYIQIAEQLSISPLTVKTHISRALNHIRDFLHQNGIEFLPVLASLLIIFF
ncbi:MAG: RNA polymerase sigma-70 factor [Chitinophagaceae bacterium]|nr:RNA polymerase sigma-70 factor [Chitinophagaceae bacterium]OQY96458.1 MAG: hypothetical protein B6D37_02870 [Sphingobacteriales bacterium UTBCD1]